MGSRLEFGGNGSSHDGLIDVQQKRIRIQDVNELRRLLGRESDYALAGFAV